MTAEEVAAEIAVRLEALDSIARAEVQGTEIFARTQGGTPFRVVVIWPGEGDTVTA